MSQNITSYFGDINISQRDVKGYNFEVRVDNILKNIGIEYTSNPLQNMKLWKRYQGVGTDFKIPSLNWELEAKYSEAKIFPSWIERDYIPRFRVGSFRVTVYNETMKWTTSSLEKCFIHDIYLVEIGYLRYVLKAEIKARSRANKLIEAKSNEKEATNSKNEAKNSKRELDCSNLEKERSQKNETITEEKTNKVLEPNSSKDIEATKAVSYESSETVDVQNTKNQSTKNQNSEKEKQKSGIEGLEPRSSKSSATFKDKFRTKLRSTFVNLLSGIEMLFSKIWNDKCGEVTLANWIPVKLKTKNKTNRARSQKIFSCPFRIILVCPYYRQFYACLIQIIDEYTSRVDRTILRHTWKSKNQILGKCRCKPISFIDDEITTRKPRNGIAVAEPCKHFRCSQLIKSNKCEWMELLSEHRSKPKQFKLEEFMNGDDEHG